MPSLGIIEALDVIEHIGSGLVSCAVRLGRRAFGLERGDEALHCRIVPDVAGSAHTTGDAVISEESLEGLTGVLAASIGVMQYGLGVAPSPNRHHECIGDELRGHCRMHGPADDPSREEIDDRGHVEPAFGGPEVGEVSDPFAVRRRGGERPVEHIRGNGDRRAHPGVRRHMPPSGPCAQRSVSHQPLDPMATAGDPVRQQIVPDAPGSIGTVAGKEAGPHPGQQSFVGLRPGTR